MRGGNKANQDSRARFLSNLASRDLMGGYETGKSEGRQKSSATVSKIAGVCLTCLCNPLARASKGSKNNKPKQENKEKKMSVALKFDSSTVEPSTFEPVPAGTYEVMAIDSNGQTTKAGNGRMVVVKFEIQTGPCKGRLLWDRFVIEHPSAEAVRINKERLSSLCRAVDKVMIDDSAELHFLPVLARVVIGAMQDGTPTNEIKGYSKVPSASTAVAPAPAPKTPAPAETVAPWG